ncbi:CoA transferase [Pseudonocardia kunmingensis]|uniref:CoA transferase n=1 Tax=Pseudonocardia kunmingensis TaxID=630975 RepID=UPI001478933D|nr:CoA transferase [Pseudonocardia kunmingensis]
MRVLELTTGQAGRTAGMLLADLGADVVRVVPPGWRPADPGSPSGPGDLCWDRGKRFTPVAPGRDAAGLRRLAGAADVLLDDAPAGAQRPAGLDAESLLASAPALVHVAMPPCGAQGRWRHLPADPLLVSALGGFATYHPSYEPGSPIASAVPMLAAVHGALGAVLATAGLLGVRSTGHGRAVETTGLHASAACLATLVVEGIDAEHVVTPDGRLGTRPSFRTYCCGDGQWLHLSALTVQFFLPALTALDRMDVMLLPGVEGEFTNTLRPEIGRAVGAELERTFAERPRDEWLAILGEAGVPCAPVLPREEWLSGEIVASAAPPVTVEHPEAGAVVLPGVPLAFSATPVGIRHLPGAAHLVNADDLWSDTRARPAPQGPAPSLPLTGLRVVDISTFLAAPFAGTLMADLGASVVKVEPPRGDPYGVFSSAYAAVNHAKTVASVDLRSPEGHAALLRLAEQADVLVDNLRPANAARLELTDSVLTTGESRLVRASVSAFGRSGPFADLPGFDPVLQSRSGLAAAQGGDDEPVATAAPTVDVATGALTAFGALAALIERERTGHGQHVTTSLAATSTFVQIAELAGYPGRPPTEQGGRDHRGPEPARRYHRAADGWLALAACTPDQQQAVAALLGLGTLTHDAVAEALATRPVEHWLTELDRLGVPACTSAPRAGFLTDPYLTENGFTHVVRDPQLGRFRLVSGYFRPVRPGPAATRADWAEATALLQTVGSLREGYAIVADPATGSPGGGQSAAMPA